MKKYLITICAAVLLVGCSQEDGYKYSVSSVVLDSNQHKVDSLVRVLCSDKGLKVVFVSLDDASETAISIYSTPVEGLTYGVYPIVFIPAYKLSDEQKIIFEELKRKKFSK